MILGENELYTAIVQLRSVRPPYNSGCDKLWMKKKEREKRTRDYQKELVGKEHVPATRNNILRFKYGRTLTHEWMGKIAQHYIPS